MTRDSLLTDDDTFVLGNLGTAAITNGRGDEAMNVIHVLQDERPDHAGGFLMEAMHLSSKGQISEAIAVLEDGAAFEATTNRDEALATHLVLLQADGQLDRALDLGHAYLDEGFISSESAHHTIRTVIEEIESALAEHQMRCA